MSFWRWLLSGGLLLLRLRGSLGGECGTLDGDLTDSDGMQSGQLAESVVLKVRTEQSHLLDGLGSGLSEYSGGVADSTVEAQSGREGVGVAQERSLLLLPDETLPSFEEHAELQALLLVLLVLPLGLVLL